MLFARWEYNKKQEDYRTGTIASVIANVNRDPAKRKEPYAPSDFFPSLVEDQPEAPPQTAEDMEQKLIGITRALGGTVIETGKTDSTK